MLNPDELTREQRGLMAVAALVTAGGVLGAVLAVLSSVLIPLVMGLFLAYTVTPFVNSLQMRLRLPRGVGLIFALLIGTGIVFALTFLIIQSVDEVSANADLYRQRLIDFAHNGVDWLREQGINIKPDAIEGELASLPMSDLARQALGSMVDIGSKAALTLIFFIFIVVGGSAWEVKTGVWERIDQSVKRYLRTKLLTSTAMGLATWGILFGFQVDLAVLFGVVGFILNFVPTVGSIITVLLTVPIVFVTLEPLSGLAVVGLLIVAQNVIGNAIEPKLMGAGLDLHPATILVGLGVWGLIWGPVGMLLSPPLTAVIRIVMARYETTRPFAELLAGRIGDRARTTDIVL
ncbi:MAG: AI-2E family transporter [Myxococcales bacterium]|nr:AI-2E family transporter [Myxococcales bacterium]MCB9732637.1 AI-2E family transporter [Deltaproteobacteria bacterium]